MKRTLLFIPITFFFVFSLTAQEFRNGSITLNSGEEVSGRIALDNSTKTVNTKNGASYSFDSVKEVKIGNRNYQRTTIDGNAMVIQTLVSGKASLYHAGGKDYLIDIDEGASERIDTGSNRNQVRGLLLVVFSDCNEIRESLNKTDDFSERNLIMFTTNYNNCSYGDYQPTAKELEQANRSNTDQVKFYAGGGLSINNVSFFDSSDTEGLTGGRWVVGVAVSPSFLGTAQGNLHFSFEASGNYSGTKDFSNSTQPVELQVNSHQFFLGLEYYFNKSGKINPFIGAGVGVAADRFKGMVVDDSFNIDGGNVVFSPRAGVMFGLNNGKHIGLLVNYITEYTNDLRFPAGERIILLDVNSQYLNFGLVYVF